MNVHTKKKKKNEKRNKQESSIDSLTRMHSSQTFAQEAKSDENTRLQKQKTKKKKKKEERKKNYAFINF